MKINKKFIFAIFILLLYIYIYREWFSFSILKGGEWQYYYISSLLNKLTTSTWITESSLGYFNNVIIYRYPIEIIQGIFGYFGFDSRISDFFIFFLPIIIGFPLSAFIAGKYFFNFKPIAILVLAVVFSFNSYFLFINAAGQLHINDASVCAVLGFFLYALSLERNKLNLFVLSLIFLFLSGVYDFRPTYLSILMIMLYSSYLAILNVTFIKSGRCNNLLSIFKEFYSNYKYLFILILFILFSFSFWLIPAYITKSINDNVAVNRGLFGGEFFDMIQSITLHHPYWNGTEPISFIKNTPPYFFWFTPIIAFIGLYLNRKNPKIIFFGLISLIGIFLTKQSAIPFGNIYQWLYSHIPGFNAFRESSKFLYLIAIGYGVLIASFIDWIWKNHIFLKSDKAKKYIITFSIFMLFLWNTKPMITGQIKTMFVPRRIPSDYIIFNKFILNQSTYFRTLWVPTVSSWSLSTNMHPKISEIGDLPPYYNIISGPIENQLIKLFNQKDSNYMFDSMSIKYVVVPLNDPKSDDNPFFYYGNNRQLYINELDKISYLKQINIHTKDLIVYENSNFKPHFYTSEFSGTNYYLNEDLKLIYKNVNPTIYQIYLSHISKPTLLHFSETYNPGWHLRVGRFSWPDSLFEKNYFLPDNFHLKDPNNLNSFIIDPKYIAQHINRKYFFVNKDGSINIYLTIYFQPQSYFYIGIILSSITIVTCIVFLLLSCIKKLKKKYE